MKYCLVGAGGHGRAVAALAEDLGWQAACYADPRPAGWLGDLPRLADRDAAELPEGLCALIGLGGVAPDQLRGRLALARRLEAQKATLPAAVHPEARVARSARIGAAAVVMPGCQVGAFSIVGFAAIVNTGAIIEHDAAIGAGTHIAPGAIVLGAAEVGEAAMVGAGAIVLPGARVAAGTLVSAGSIFRAANEAAR